MSSSNNNGISDESYNQILKEKDKILSLIYDTVGDVIFALKVNSSGDYIFSSVNQSFLNATGLLKDQVIGKNVKEVIPEPSLSSVLDYYQQAITTKTSVSWEEVTPYPTGTKVGEVRIAPVFGEDDNCTMLIGSVHDITESRNYAKKLEDSMEKIAQKNYELEQLGYVTSHDLQEPLNTIQSFSMLLNEEFKRIDNSEKINKYLNYISKATGRMKILLKGILDFNVVGRTTELKTTNLKTLVEGVLSDLAGSIMQENAKITVSDLPTMNVYASELRLLFQNLISNSIKYKRPDYQPFIEINGKEKEGKWEFEIIDNGIGISEEYFERIFHVFQRLHKKNEYEGAGIGLSICKKIIDLHEGQIWVEKNSPYGTKFFFTLSDNLE
ncbi:ATP-binding protein [Flammeovirga pacifica]|uniref:histidine kinase n=1 Tax=Flammeovirga pacifica TaxID=915059 RepID=A0A1S1YTH8_FLAPC|nr:ATP-binding protein [Flammeovirga pacifica]OHX64318.1 hypothetical protein NH26_22245 [Flammeovirga pacifica]